MIGLRERLSGIAAHCAEERPEKERETEQAEARLAEFREHNARQIERCIDRVLTPALEDLESVLKEQGIAAEIERLTPRDDESGTYRLLGIRLSAKGAWIEYRGDPASQAFSKKESTPMGTGERRHAFSATSVKHLALAQDLERFLRKILSGAPEDAGRPW